MAVIRPAALNPAESVPTNAAIPLDTGSEVARATPEQIVDAAIPLASENEAVEGSDNTKRVTPLRVKQAMDANMATTAALASTDPGKGAAMIGMSLLDANAVAVDVAELLRAGGINAAEFGVSSSASASVNAAAFQKAVDYARANSGVLVLPAGEIALDDDVTIAPMSGAAGDRIFKMVGQGPGENGTFLHFSSGSLIVEDYHEFRDFRVTSDTDDGIVIQPNAGPPVRYPVRSSLQNVWTMNCGKSGITISDCWEYMMLNVYSRYNAEWGIKGISGPNFSMACNALLIAGGQFQGNGTIAGTPTGSGGSAKGTGGGINLGPRGVQQVLIGCAIEGNVGDGLNFGEETRGLSIIGVYFEKNGSHPDNCDIYNEAPSAPALGPHSVFILNCNFTPQGVNGTAQVRAIDITDCLGLKIVNPQFFAQSGPLIYTAEPIRVQETSNGRCSGWVEGGSMIASAYTQPILKNLTRRFGFPRRYVFSPNFELTQGAGDTTWGPAVIPMPSYYATGVDVKHITRAVSSSGVARILRDVRRGPAGTVFSQTASDVTYAGSTNSVITTSATTGHADLPGTHLEVRITRDEDHANDTLAASVTLQSVEVTLYEGWVGSHTI